MLPTGFKLGDDIPLPSEQGSGHGFVPDASLRGPSRAVQFAWSWLTVFSKNH